MTSLTERLINPASEDMEIIEIMKGRIQVVIEFRVGMSTKNPGKPMGAFQAAADELVQVYGINILRWSSDDLVRYYRTQAERLFQKSPQY